jgi:tRNA uridine 5-carbamoylmethylation protein Kti12
MIVELTGIPGAGKSTLLESLRKVENKAHFVFDIQGFILKDSLLPFRGKIAYELALYSKVYLLRAIDITLLKNVMSIALNK